MSELNVGVVAQFGGQIMAGSGGDVTVTGTGGNGGGLYNHGISIESANSHITSSGGDVSVTGLGGGVGASSHNNYGVQVLDAGQILAGGSGTVIVVGSGGNSSGGGHNNRGRSRQMNSGAALASGEILLFLHADTLLPLRYAEYVRECMAANAIAGAFRLRFDNPQRALHCVAWGANVRSRFRQLPYGDQAPFLRAETFFQLGGYRNWPMFEDYDLARRLGRIGRIDLLSTNVISSARRQLRRGVLKTVLLNQVCIAAFRLGISPNRIAHWYGLSLL